MLKLSVNILTWNCIDTLRETLDILHDDLKDIEYEIIIIDNGSTDGCAELATIRNEGNQGVSIGKNQGIKASGGEYIFMLDGDIVPVKNSINCLLEWLETNKGEYAIGFYPNKFTNQKNKNGQVHHETYCRYLFEPRIHTQAIAFYGLFRRSMFDDFWIMFPEEGPFGECGYGWEDSDLYMQMRDAEIQQWVAGINSPIGRYYHEINSSIRLMGHDKYMATSRARGEAFNKKWGEKVKQVYG
jgi:glycosyltransferase involved in cell wall biosynthesis